MRLGRDYKTALNIEIKKDEISVPVPTRLFFCYVHRWVFILAVYDHTPQRVRGKNTCTD